MRDLSSFLLTVLRIKIDGLKTKMNKDYDIRPVKTSKDAIKHPKLSEEGVIPKLNCSTILVGKSGSGKSVLLHNLLTRKEFFHGHFDKIFLISPTGETVYSDHSASRLPVCLLI